MRLLQLWTYVLVFGARGATNLRYYLCAHVPAAAAAVLADRVRCQTMRSTWKGFKSPNTDAFDGQ